MKHVTRIGQVFFITLCFISSCVWGQVGDTSSSDTLVTPKNTNKLMKYQRFDILLSRGFLLSEGPDAATAPINSARSGTSHLSLGFNLVLSHRLSIDLEPGFSFFRIYFSDGGEKRFPVSDSAGFSKEKLRIAYLDLPVCLRMNIAYEDEVTPIAFIQAGVGIGRRIGSSYKFTTNDTKGNEYAMKSYKAEGLELYRLYALGRLIYKRIGVQVTYRFSDIFQQNLKTNSVSTGNIPVPRTTNVGGVGYPRFANWEFGFSIII